MERVHLLVQDDSTLVIGHTEGMHVLALAARHALFYLSPNGYGHVRCRPRRARYALGISTPGDCSLAACSLDLQPCSPQPYNLQLYLHPCTLQPCTRVGGIGRRPRNSKSEIQSLMNIPRKNHRHGEPTRQVWRQLQADSGGLADSNRNFVLI